MIYTMRMAEADMFEQVEIANRTLKRGFEIDTKLKLAKREFKT